MSAPKLRPFGDWGITTHHTVEHIMLSSSRPRRVTSTLVRSAPHLFAAAAFLALVTATKAECQTPSGSGLLASRAELSAEAAAAEVGATTTGDAAQRAQSGIRAAAIRQRLRDGDLQVGDRVVVTIISDAVHRDTVVVRSERSLELPGMITVSVAGLLRSELRERVSAEVLKYVKAQKIEVTPLMRVGVLGAVARPGYFAFPPDMPITDAIMGAGGPTGIASVERSIVRRRNEQYRSAGETSRAIAAGLTLDQFGLIAGDELVVGERREFGVTKLMTVTGALASVLAVVVTMSRR